MEGGVVKLKVVLLSVYLGAKVCSREAKAATAAAADSE